MGDYIVFKNVVKEYKIGEESFKALNMVNFNIPKGKFVVILGPSGAGKSTILNLLGGMDSVTKGKIMVDGEDISDYSKSKLAEYRAENVGFIFQFYNILPSLTVEENVDIVKDIVKRPKNCLTILKEVGLLKHKNKFPAQLSGGEQQRVSIARAIAKDPKLLLCDEPTGALDSKTGASILKLLKKQCEGGKNTVVVVTHNALIADVSDIVIRIKNGQVESIVKNENPKNIDEVVW
ncbi:MAG: ABC transporter ATP-binding protein [Bacilli bacterium]|nr:ABC transporter ATP-binding protein [Bacilli bacterium]